MYEHIVGEKALNSAFSPDSNSLLYILNVYCALMLFSHVKFYCVGLFRSGSPAAVKDGPARRSDPGFHSG